MCYYRIGIEQIAADIKTIFFKTVSKNEYKRRFKEQRAGKSGWFVVHELNSAIVAKWARENREVLARDGVDIETVDAVIEYLEESKQR